MLMEYIWLVYMVWSWTGICAAVGEQSS